MSKDEPLQSRVRIQRLARNWSQAELAELAGISRAAVSAIEGQRLVPSVAAALALAAVFECSVEELFGSESLERNADIAAGWAWPCREANPFGGEHSSIGYWSATDEPIRYWCASVQGRLLAYPVEATPLGELPHDGISRFEINPLPLISGKGVAGEASRRPSRQVDGRRADSVAGEVTRRQAERTLVIAGCDPAAGLLARVYEQATGHRMLVIPRSSRRALELAEQGLVHVAGVHLSAANEQGGNAASVKQVLSRPARLLHLTEWEAGVALGSASAAATVRGVLRERLTWIGREAGSGARQCLDELLQNRPAPKRLASDHRGVAAAIRCGWGDAGICLKLVAQEAGLRFLPIRTEGYDFCYSRDIEDDPRILALVRVVQSPEVRRLVGELPGYDSRRAGELSAVG